jgi:hypothetical protein
MSYLDDLPIDVLVRIYKSLPFIYQIAFARACAVIWRNTSSEDRNIHEKIKTTLHNRYVKGLYEAITECGATIIGSFLHDILFDTDHCNIVNILYSDVCPDMNPTDWTYQSEYTCRVEQFSDCMLKLRLVSYLWGRTIPGNPYHCDDCVLLGIGYLSSYAWARHIDLFAADNSLQVFIDRTDFDFCKLYYKDGALTVFNLKSLLTKTSPRPSCVRYGDETQQQARIALYKSRGFAFN